MTNVLVVAAHPDDEILGCGATIHRHASEGDNVHIAIMAEGLTSRSKDKSKTSLANELLDLKQVANRANKLLGAKSVDFFDFPDNRMDAVPLLEIVKSVEALLEKYNPTIVYTHFSNDVNIDHQLTYEAVITACRPMPGCNVEKILVFEVMSSTEWRPSIGSSHFSPNYFVDISSSLEKKIKALQIYESEMRDWPHPRSYKAIHSLSNYRGATIGVDAAESFMLLRYINRE